MIPSFSAGYGNCARHALAAIASLATPIASLATLAATTAVAGAGAGAASTPVASASTPAASKVCLASGDGYLRARLAGAVDAHIDWPNQGTRCEGEAKSIPPGVRMSFQRTAGAKPDLLFVFGLTGVREGESAHESGVNLTVIVQGTPRIFGTLGDSRCTVDSLTQKALPGPHVYRVEVRGFCTQPAHAVRGDGDVLVSTFEFAGQVNYGVDAGVAAGAATAAAAATKVGSDK